jgi:dTDP-4-dehydrorhamnose reductase
MLIQVNKGQTMKILLTGAEGYLGTKLLDQLKIKLQCHIPNRENFNTKSYNSVEVEFEKCKPDVVIHLAEISDPDYCRRYAPLAYKTNLIGTSNVIECCKKYGSKLIYMSSSSAIHTVNKHGMWKIFSEKFIQEFGVDAVIIRLDKIYGEDDEFTKTVLEILKNKETVPLNDNNLRYPVHISDVVRVIGENLIGAFEPKTVNLSPSKGFTKYKWACKLAKSFGYSDKNILSNKTLDIDTPADAKLDSDIKVLNLDEGIKLVKKNYVEKE